MTIYVPFYGKQFILHELVDRLLGYARFFGGWMYVQDKGVVRLSTPLVLYNAFLNVFFIATLIPKVKELTRMDFQTEMSQATVEISKILFTAEFLIPSVVQIYHFKDMKKLFNDFCEIAEILSRKGFSHTSRGPNIAHCIFSYVVVTLGLGILFYNKSIFSYNEFSFIVHLMLLSIILQSLVFCFYLIIFCVDIYYNAINEHLSRVQLSIKPTRRIDEILALVDLHSSLCSITENIEKVFGAHNLCLMTMFLTTSVVQSYFFVDIFRRKHESNYFLSLIHLIWLVYCIINCLTMVRGVESISRKAKEFNISLFQMMIEDDTNVLIENEKLLLHIHMNKEIIFTACGLFTIDYTLIYSMFAAISTYIIILIDLT